MWGASRPVGVFVCVLVLSAGAVPAQTRYIAFGDSITEGVGDDPARPEQGYPPRLEDLLQQAGENAVVVNRGVGAERTPEGLSRIDEVLAEGGDVLLLMEGTNDVTRFISHETSIFNLRTMAERAEAQGFEVVHGTLIPRIPDARVDAENIGNSRLNHRIRDMAGKDGRDLADHFEVFSTLQNPFATHYFQDPEDHVGHPNSRGYDVMARTWFEVLVGNDTVPPVAGRTSPNYGAIEVSPTAAVSVDVWDFGSGIDLSATSLVLNGVEVDAELSGGNRGANLRYRPPRPLEGTVRVALRSRDRSSPANTVDREVLHFRIEGAPPDDDGLRGDIDGDGRVDGTDLVLLALAFGSERGQGRYRPSADLDSSGRVDGQDLAILSSNFGRTDTGGQGQSLLASAR
jgi:lysophospholipase L1-like esterase